MFPAVSRRAQPSSFLVLHLFFPEGLVDNPVDTWNGKWLRQSIEAVPVAIYLTDAHGRILHYNREAVRLWDRSPRIEEEAERFFEGLGVLDSRGGRLSYAQCPMGRTLETGEATTGTEIMMERPEGAAAVIWASAAPIRDEDGRMVGVVNCLIDVTERRQSTERIAELERRARRLEGLAERLAEDQRRERRELAQRLHDDLQQMLAGVKMEVGLLTRVEPERLLQRIERIMGHLDEAVGSVRSLSGELRPAQREEARPEREVALRPGKVDRRLPKGGRVRVLLADDHRVVRSGLRAMLEREADLEVVAEADDGLEAVDLALAHRPEVVVMDVSMPRLGGIEAARRIREALPAVKIIGLSMHCEASTEEAMHEAGVIAYLPKCGPTSSLVSAIRSCAVEAE